MSPTLRHHHPNDGVPPRQPLHGGEIASLLLLAAVGFVVAAFAVHACYVR